jgi:hypothetical protein
MPHIRYKVRLYVPNLYSNLPTTMSYSKDNTSTGLRDTGGNTHSGYNPTNPQYGRDTCEYGTS